MNDITPQKSINRFILRTEQIMHPWSWKKDFTAVVIDITQNDQVTTLCKIIAPLLENAYDQPVSNPQIFDSSNIVLENSDKNVCALPLVLKYPDGSLNVLKSFGFTKETLSIRPMKIGVSNVIKIAVEGRK